MSTISLRLPESLHDTARKVAGDEHISINQFITIALAEKISALLTGEYLGGRAKRGNRKSFEKVMSKVHDTEPPERDRL